jgi:hypothetical protein
MVKMPISLFAFAFAFVPSAEAAELPYRFRSELEIVHEENVRDRSLQPRADEFVFADAMAVSVPESDFLRRVAIDFADYLLRSQGVSVRVASGSGVAEVKVGISPGLRSREYTLDVSRGGIEIEAADERAAAQAFYHLEDLMNLRRSPFLKIGKSRRRILFSPRMIHSGWGIDTYPEPYLTKAAHHGFDAILVFVPEAGKTQRGWDDINAIIRRAAKWGIDTYLYSYVHAPVHPDDPQASRIFADTYGAIARSYPAARGYIFVGESCQFPSRDRRTNGKIRPELPEPGDDRPYPCMFPCSDYPDWLCGVKNAIARHSPDAEIVFWTYNFCAQPSSVRLPLLRKMPRDVSLLVTFEMFEPSVKSNGLRSWVSDYSLSDPGPGAYYLSEAEECAKLGLRLYTQANTAGLTWDLGTVPYLPCPQQWKKRWDALRKSKCEHNLLGLMEGHHYGWTPSFVTELSKEAFTEGGIPFDEHIKAIAGRDFGDANGDAAVEAWRKLSDAIADSFPCPQNLAGPYRIGPAFPFNFTTSRIEYSQVPFPKASAYIKNYCWTYFNYLEDFAKARFPPSMKVDWQVDQIGLEIELLDAMIAKCDGAADTFASIAVSPQCNSVAKARKMSDLSRYMARCYSTVRNLKLGVLAFLAGDKAKLLETAKAEYANKAATLELVDRDSRLGWEPSMDYIGSRAMIEWAMEHMRKAYDLK